MDAASELAAGDFSAWLTEVRGAIRGEHAAEVPCGTCTACCTSSQFVHIAPDEIQTLARVPRALQFPAPHLPRGHVVLGYDERGHCPMLIDNQCSIYEHRPRTCRTYDCRVFPAAGIELDEAEKQPIADQARRWRFSYPNPADRIAHDAVRATAARIVEDPTAFGEAAPLSNTQVAVMAVERGDQP